MLSLEDFCVYFTVVLYFSRIFKKCICHLFMDKIYIYFFNGNPTLLEIYLLENTHCNVFSSSLDLDT